MLLRKRPFLIKLYNQIGSTAPLQVDTLIEKAQKRCKLNNFGTEPFYEGLCILVDSINEEAALHAFGRFIMQERIISILCNRLRIEAYCKQHPDVNTIQIEKPIIITGLQRTGTTRLQRLLSAHPQLRSLSSWEALNPVPIEGDAMNKKRIQQARIAEKALRYMSPEFFSIHPVEYNAPDEDILINDMTFVSTVPEATLHVPSYAAWVETQDHSNAYRYLKKVLQVLTHQNGPQRWVLKTPQYLEFIDIADKQFPDAYWLHCYRDPQKVLPSFFSMIYYSRRIFSDQVLPEECARHWLRKNAYMLTKAMNYWNTNTHIQIQHISYYDMMRQAMQCIQDICKHSSLDYNHNIESSIQQFASQNTQHKYGVHHYDISDFSIHKEEISSLFSSYVKQFEIPNE